LQNDTPPITGAWVLENGFSIEARMYDLICNLLFPSLTV